MGSTADEVKGRAKEAAGAVTDDEKLKTEGKLDQIGADIKRWAEESQQKVEDVIDAIKNKLS